MQYEALDIQIVELDAEDVIQTSEIIGGAGGENESPFQPAAVNNLDSTF